MARKYFVWKDPACGGVNKVWMELSGKEFYAMMKLPENKRRHFIRMGNDICPEADIIFIEATKQEYADWRRDQNASIYRARQRKGVSTLSLDCQVRDADVDTLHETVGDEQVDVERAALSHIAHEQLDHALETLADDEIQLLTELYVRSRSVSDIAREQNVHRSTITRRVSAVLCRLQNFF